MKIKRAKSFMVMVIILSAVGCAGITFSIKKSRNRKGFTLVFNDKTANSSAKNYKSFVRQRDQPIGKKHDKIDLKTMIEEERTKASISSRKLILGEEVGGAALGGLAAGAGGALLNSMMNKSTKEIIREKGIEYRSLQLKNDTEKENLMMLFHAKMNMSKLVSMTGEISSAVEFMIHRKLALLQQNLPEIAV